MSQDRTHSPDIGAVSPPRVDAHARPADFFELTKPRLSLLSALTAVVGYLAADAARPPAVFLALLAGTGLAAGGAAALNQWLEREADARMARTRGRPIPSGRVDPRHALAFGLALALSGCALLHAATHPLAGVLAAATVASYLLLYTPLKRLTTWNTLVGAVPGALPPLIGWAAAEGRVGPLGWLLFGILFLWQLPHFFAIAWTHRRDYARAGFVMLPRVDPTGARLARQCLLFTLALVGASLLPFCFGYADRAYAIIALALGALLLRPALRFLRADRRDAAARSLFLASIIYLPALLLPLVLDLRL